MEKPCHKCHILYIYTSLVFFSCSIKPVIYEEPVLLNKEPNVSIRYTHDKVTVIIPVKSREGNPSAYKVSLFQKGRMATPSYEKLFFPGDSIKMILPEGIWSNENFGNVMSFTPVGEDFQTVTQMFHISGPGIYHLDPVSVRKEPVVIRGIVMDRGRGIPIPMALVEIMDSTKVLTTIKTDSLGFFRKELRHHYFSREDIVITVDTEDEFPLFTYPLGVMSEKSNHVDIQLGMSPEMTARGTLFRVNRHLVPFREGPENGSPTIVMLSKGDRFLVSKVSGDRSFGYVEITEPSKDIQVEFSGWVLSKYLEIVE